MGLGWCSNEKRCFKNIIVHADFTLYLLESSKYLDTDQCRELEANLAMYKIVDLMQNIVDQSVLAVV